MPRQSRKSRSLGGIIVSNTAKTLEAPALKVELERNERKTENTSFEA